MRIPSEEVLEREILIVGVRVEEELEGLVEGDDGVGRTPHLLRVPLHEIRGKLLQNYAMLQENIKSNFL